MIQASLKILNVSILDAKTGLRPSAYDARASILKRGTAKRVNSNNPVRSCSRPSGNNRTCAVPKVSCAPKVLCAFCSSVARTVTRAFTLRRRAARGGNRRPRRARVEDSHRRNAHVTHRVDGPPSVAALRASRCLRLFRSAQRLEPKLHGQGPRAEADAARRLPPRSCIATTGELQPP